MKAEPARATSPRYGRAILVLASATVILAAACGGGGGGEQTPPPGGSGGGLTGQIPAAANPAPDVPSQLHTDGTRLVGPDGKTIRLVGVNLQGLQFTNDDGSSEPDQCGRAWKLPQMHGSGLRRAGFNTVRLPISWANIEPTPPTSNGDGTFTHHWNEEYLQAVDQVIQDLTSAKLAVVLDNTQFHMSSAFKAGMGDDPSIQCEGLGYPAWMYPNADSLSVAQARCDFAADRAQPGVEESPWEGHAAVWKLLAERYANTSGVVAADVVNEPFFHSSGCQGADFTGMYDTVGKAIREAAPGWLLIFQYLTPALKDFGITGPPQFQDQMFSIHVYQPDWNAAEQEMSEAWTVAQSWKMPAFLGEFDAFARAALSGQDWQGQTRDMLQWMKARNWSWTVFPYAGGAAQASQGVQSKQPVSELISTLQTGL